MMTLQPLRGILLAALLSCLSSSFCATETLCLLPIADEASFAKAQEFYRIHFSAAKLINSGVTDRYDLGSADGVVQVADSIATETAIVERLSQDGPTSPSCDGDLFEALVLPEVFRFKAKYDVAPTTETLRRFLSLNAGHYPRQEWVVAEEILVRPRDWGDETSAVVSRIRTQLQSEPFSKVAFLYNESVGAKGDGRLGRLLRGQVPDWKFDLFMKARQDEAFFGPVTVPDGWYFGKVDARMTSDADLFEFYRDKVVQDYRRIFARERVRHALTESQRRLNPEVNPYDEKNPAGPAQVAYSLAGTTVTFEQCRKRLPFLVGDTRTARYWDSMCSQSLQNHLLFLREDVQQLRESPEFRYLAAAYRNTCLIEQHMQAQLSHLTDDDDALRALYEKRASTPGYLQPDMVRMLIARMPPTSGTLPHVDRELITRVRNQFADSPTTETLERLQHTAPSLVFWVDGKFGPIDRLGRVIEMAIGNEGAGFVTPVFVGRDGAFYFARVLERERGKPKAFEEVREQLRTELREQRRERLLESLYGKGVFKRMIPD